MANWLFNLPVFWMTLVIFLGTFLVSFIIYLTVTRLAVGERAAGFRALAPGLLSPLGVIFGLLVAFTAAQVWDDYGRAEFAVANEASALRSVVLLAKGFPGESETRLRTLINRHIEAAIGEEWPKMARQQKSLKDLPVDLVEALKTALALPAADEGQKTIQREIIGALEKALDARRQRIILSHSTVTPIKWVTLLLQALAIQIAIGVVHSHSRLACAIGLALFGTGIALSILLIAAYRNPFSGDLAVSPDLLQQVIATET